MNSGNALRTLPPRAAAYFKSKRDRLSRRADYRDGPPWTLFRTRAALGAHRVVWPDLARRLEAAALTGHASAFIPMNTCYVLNAAGWHCRAHHRSAAQFDLAPGTRHDTCTARSEWLPALQCARHREPSVPSRHPRGCGPRACRTGTPSDDAAVAIDERVAQLLELTPEERNALSEIIAAPRC